MKIVDLTGTESRTGSINWKKKIDLKMIDPKVTGSNKAVSTSPAIFKFLAVFNVLPLFLKKYLLAFDWPN